MRALYYDSEIEEEDAKMMFLACEMLMFGGPSVLLRQKPRTPCHEVAGLRGFQSPKSRSTEPPSPGSPTPHLSRRQKTQKTKLKLGAAAWVALLATPTAA